MVILPSLVGMLSSEEQVMVDVGDDGLKGTMLLLPAPSSFADGDELTND